LAVSCIVQKSRPSSNVKVKGQGHWGQKPTKCGILFGSRPLGRDPRVAFFSGVVLGAPLCWWENQCMLSSCSLILTILTKNPDCRWTCYTRTGFSVRADTRSSLGAWQWTH